MKASAWRPRRGALEDPWTAPVGLQRPAPRPHAAWRAELQEYRDKHMAIAFGDDTEGREPIVHPETGETINVADLDGIGQFLKKMYSEEVPEPFRWPKYM